MISLLPGSLLFPFIQERIQEERDTQGSGKEQYGNDGHHWRLPVRRSKHIINKDHLPIYYQN